MPPLTLKLVLRFPSSVFILVALLLGVVACGDRNRTATKLAQDSSSVQAAESNLTFNDVTLEQANEQGQPFWKVKAKQATYNKNKKTAQVQQPVGELFQDGKVVYKIVANRGEIRQDGKQLFLKGQIVATDPRTGLVLRGNELEWQPQKDLLIVRNQMNGTYKKMRVESQEGRVNSRTQRMDLQGKVVAKTTDNAWQIRTEQAIWEIPNQKLIGDRPVEIDRYKGTTVTDRATANRAEFDLKTEIATLRQNAQLNIVQPPMQITSNEMNWNINAQAVTANQPVQMVHRQKQMTVSAKQGRMDLQKEIVYFTGDVYGVGQRGQSLNSSQMIWYIPTQLVEAQGNVVYRQIEPSPVNFVGQKAVGKLDDQSMVLSGGRVVTEIVP